MPESVLKLISESQARFVDFRFTDPKGKWQHTSYYSDMVNKELLEDGVPFDGSSIAGWKTIDQSDMLLKPDHGTAFLDPFTSIPTVIVTCDVFEPFTGEAYDRDPRTTALKAEDYIRDLGIADTAFFGPEVEFFVFDDVRFDVAPHHTFFSLDHEEGPYNSGRHYPAGNMGHRPQTKGGYVPVAPIDSLNDIRAEMMIVLAESGLTPILHHHEVAPSQSELGFKYAPITETGDNLQKYKYIVHNVAASYGKTATFMPKPVKEDNGTGMHCHQSLWKDGKNLFAGDGYAQLSDTALYYIGGIIKHIKAINAFTNPTTNSYKRLVPGFEAPVNMAYSSRNRSAAIRIPVAAHDNAIRLECRFPDPTANPYLGLTAMLMAGIDGIQNKIHPGEAVDKNLYELEAEELKQIPSVSHSLGEALRALEEDREFLTKGNVFTHDQIDAYVALLQEDVDEYNMTPHPLEFKKYFSV